MKSSKQQKSFTKEQFYAREDVQYLVAKINSGTAHKDTAAALKWLERSCVR
jgi:hypothetical protein